MPKKSDIPRRFRSPLAQLYFAAAGKCFYCGIPVLNQRFPHERDWLMPHPRRAMMAREHKMPTIRGGDDSSANVVCSCQGCNSQKGSFTLDEFRLVTGLRRADLSFRFCGEPAVLARDWIICHSDGYERHLLLHNIPSAAAAFGLRNGWARSARNRGAAV